MVERAERSIELGDGYSSGDDHEPDEGDNEYYAVKVICSNCGLHGAIGLIKGIRVVDSPCPKCGCDDLERWMEYSLDPRNEPDTDSDVRDIDTDAREIATSSIQATGILMLQGEDGAPAQITLPNEGMVEVDPENFPGVYSIPLNPDSLRNDEGRPLPGRNNGPTDPR